MPRVFSPLPPDGGDTFPITGEDARHLALSLRMKVGDAVTVCDGLGMEASCVIEAVTPGLLTVRVLDIRESAAEPPVSVTLCVALGKADKFEWVLQKGTELGAAAFRPFLSERCISKPSDAARKLERWNKIVREASMQSGRGILPTVYALVPFREAVEQTPGTRRCLCHGAASIGLTGALDGITGACALFTGPEGGFTPAEVQAAVQSGIVPVSLGPRTLRCETAPIAALAVVMSKIGNM